MSRSAFADRDALGRGTLERRPYARRGEAIVRFFCSAGLRKRTDTVLARIDRDDDATQRAQCVVERRGGADRDWVGLLLPAATAGVEVRIRGSAYCPTSACQERCG